MADKKKPAEKQPGEQDQSVETRADVTTDAPERTPKGPREPVPLTRQMAQEMIQEVVGQTFAQMQERAAEDRKVWLEQMRNFAPQPKTPEEGDFRAALSTLVTGVAKYGNDVDRIVKHARDMGDEVAERALSTVTVASGGALVVPEFSSDFINYLRNKSVVMQSGVMRVDMPSGLVHFPKMTTGATAAYRGEAAAGTVSAQTFGSVNLSAKILDVMVPVTNQMLNRTPSAQAIIEQDMANAVSEKTDATFIRSSGSSDRPQGLLYLAASGNKFNETNAAGTTGGSTTAERILDMGTMMKLLMDAKNRMTAPVWLLGTNTYRALNTMLDANSNYIFREEMSRGELNGFPFFWTQNIPNNLTAAAGSGGGADASELYLYNAPDIMVGETAGLTLKASSDASYTTGGSLRSTFENDETLIKAQLEHDLGTRYNDAIVVLESVTWGNA